MSGPEIAVRVDHVSKTYQLWRSPRERLAYPFRRLAASVLPPALRPGRDAAASFQEFHALHDISFEVAKGESWGVVGTNGSGKSTLLKIVSGNLRPSAGTVEVDGKTAILDYSSGLNGEFTGRENVYLKGAIFGLGKKDIDERFGSIESFADIGEFIDQPVKTYSSGMGARLGFAIMAHVDADILITDEALAVGDAFFVQKCMRHIRAFLSRGTFLFVSHSINDVMSLCNKAIWLEHGKVQEIGEAKEVCRAYMSSIDRKRSQHFLSEGGAGKAPARGDGSGSPSAGPAPQVPKRPNAGEPIRMTAEQLARLRNYLAPPREAPDIPSTRQALVSAIESNPPLEAMELAGSGVGGGRIIDVSITNAARETVSSVIGGEEIWVEVTAVAEKRIARPIVGFQFKNYMGLSIIAENTAATAADKDLALEPGMAITARFGFRMPLVPVGEYVIRAGLADGSESANALIDVVHEAAILHCTTSAPRHGLVGVPLTGLEIAVHDVHAG
jgi:lipopolysaccharide transport system ATP-binding protein